MKGYKGFEKDMTCRGFQYEAGKTYTTDRAELCHSGFHFCEQLADCFDYYDKDDSVFYEVEVKESMVPIAGLEPARELLPNGF